MAVQVPSLCHRLVGGRAHRVAGEPTRKLRGGPPLFVPIRKLIRLLAEVCNCPSCGSASYYHNGTVNVCMDCGAQWT